MTITREGYLRVRYYKRELLPLRCAWRLLRVGCCNSNFDRVALRAASRPYHSIQNDHVQLFRSVHADTQYQLNIAGAAGAGDERD